MNTAATRQAIQGVLAHHCGQIFAGKGKYLCRGCAVAMDAGPTALRAHQAEMVEKYLLDAIDVGFSLPVEVRVYAVVDGKQQLMMEIEPLPAGMGGDIPAGTTSVQIQFRSVR